MSDPGTMDDGFSDVPSEEVPAWFLDLHQSADSQPPDPIQLLWFHQIRPSFDTNDFVQGLLMEQSAVVVYGESNAGKTFWVTDLSLHVAAGIPWNGRRVEQGGVVYCAMEGGGGFRNRLAAWGVAHDLEAVEIPFAAIPMSLNLLDPNADTPRLTKAIQAAGTMINMPVKLVVIDTLSRALAGGNENAADDMGALVRNMDTVRNETGTCVLFIHHCGKDQTRGARGHSLLRAAIDTEVEVVAAEGGVKTATVVKQRELSKGDAFGFTLEPIELGSNRHGEAVTTCIVAAAAAPLSTTKTCRLPASLEVGLRALGIAMSKTGTLLPATGEYPANTPAVRDEEWRHEFYQLHSGTAEAKRKAFQRTEEQLLARKLITQRNGLVWEVRQEGVS